LLTRGKKKRRKKKHSKKTRVVEFQRHDATPPPHPSRILSVGQIVPDYTVFHVREDSVRRSLPLVVSLLDRSRRKCQIQELGHGSGSRPFRFFVNARSSDTHRSVSRCLCPADSGGVSFVANLRRDERLMGGATGQLRLRDPSISSGSGECQWSARRSTIPRLRGPYTRRAEFGTGFFPATSGSRLGPRTAEKKREVLGVSSRLSGGGDVPAIAPGARVVGSWIGNPSSNGGPNRRRASTVDDLAPPRCCSIVQDGRPRLKRRNPVLHRATMSQACRRRRLEGRPGFGNRVKGLIRAAASVDENATSAQCS